MTTLLLVLTSFVVVGWVVAKAARTDRTDETLQFAQVQQIVGKWSDEAGASQSRNDLANTD